MWGGQVRWTPEQPALRHVAQQAAPACRLRCRVNPDRWSGRYGHEKRKQGARRAAIMLAGRWERCRAKCLPQYTSRHQRPCNDRKGQKSCRSEEHTSELQSLMRISYAVFCLKKKKK